MASTTAVAFLAVLLVLQPRIALSDLLSPLLSPLFDNVCKEVECGKGTCKASSNSTFECECKPGWKQVRSDDDDHLKFLPCVVPNCTLNYSCANASSPVQEKERRANESIFDRENFIPLTLHVIIFSLNYYYYLMLFVVYLIACYWTDCRGGHCNKTSAFTYNCECAEGYYNLLNATFLPCFQECAIGMDCKNLGISLTNKSTSGTPALADDGKNQATSILQGNSLWLIILMMSMAMVLWK